MSQSRINLLPERYRADRLKKRALRVWSSATGLCLLAMLAMLAMGGAKDQPVDTTALQAKLNFARGQSEQLSAKTDYARRSVAAAQRELVSSRQIADQPNLKLLLQIVGQQLGEKSMLSSLRMGWIDEPAIRAGVGTVDGRAKGRWLIVTGIAEDHRSVPEIVLRLEKLRLFPQVILGETWAERYRGNSVVGFRISCRMPGATEAGGGDD